MLNIWFEDNVRCVSINNRRYLGNKYRLLPFIDSVIRKNCVEMRSLADIFAGTGAVASGFPDCRIITNDILYSNYICHVAWFGEGEFSADKIFDAVSEYNRAEILDDNYMSEAFGDTYFSREVCRKIGFVREDVEERFRAGDLTFRERAILLTSLLYAMDKIANTCGHYDAYRRGVAPAAGLEMRAPTLNENRSNAGNRCFNRDANLLVREIDVDLVYIDPPYNSRQYCDSYHVLENVARWEKPEVFGVARKMDRGALKSRYCTQEAAAAFRDLIENICARYILVSYNNMAESGDGRSNARISDQEILAILSERGEVKVFSENYKAFTAGKSFRPENEERLFLVTVR